MPVMSAYVGLQDLTFLLYKSSKETVVARYPFIYSASIFGSDYTEEQYYDQIFTYLASVYGVELGKCTVYLSGYLRPVPVTFKTSANVSHDAVTSQLGSSKAFFIPGLTSYSTDLDMSADLKDFLSNLSLCPFARAEDLYIKAYLNSELERVYRPLFPAIPDAGTPVLFTGDALLSWNGSDLSEVYLFVMNLVDSSGIFDLRVDTQNLFIPMTLLKMHDEKTYNNVAQDHSYSQLGTVFKTTGAVECLFETEVGTSQFVEVLPNQLFFMPLGEGSRAKVYIKNSSFGQYEGYVTGGDLGFIIDTREANKDNLLTDDYENVLGGKSSFWEKQIKGVLNKI